MTLTLPERPVTSPDHRPLTTSHSTPQAFRFRTYQREDLARAALHDGAILAWDPGLGKTMAIFAWPFLKRARRTLIVAPASLHAQIMKEGREKFGVTVTPIRDQAAALDLMRRGILPFPGQSSIDNRQSTIVNPPTLPQFFIVDYRWLGYNGADHVVEANSDQIKARIPVIARSLNLAPSDLPTWFFDAEQPAPTEVQKHLKRYPVKIQVAYSFVREAMANIGITRTYHSDNTQSSIANLQSEITCCFSPSLADLIGDSFDCAVCDEAVRLMSGTESYIARGVMRLNASYRLALTGTPIKNRLPDIFFLATWVCGLHPAGSPRFPYGCTQSHKAGFANNHLIMEENLSKTEKSRREGTGRRFVKQVNKLTNVHRLWKLLGPVVVRRRKDDIGEDLVKKNIRPVKVMPGTAQLATYQWHLENPPECATKTAAIGAQLQLLRMAALCPWSVPANASAPASTWSPKIAAILHLAADLMEKDEQLVVFSPFQDFSTALQSHFRSAGVDSILLDGRVNNLKRGALAADFKDRKHPVLIAGIASMGEGHSFECASHLVLPSLSWAYDENAQAIERVHRLMSRKDVTIYTLVTTNTIDERLAQLFDEKGDASDLALDGRLFEDEREEVSLEELLHSARTTFSAAANTLDESELEAEWHDTLKPRLALAAAKFQGKPSAKCQPEPAPKPPHSPRGARAARPQPSTSSPITDHGSPGTSHNIIEFPGLFAPVSTPPNPLPKPAQPATLPARRGALSLLADAFA